jgi:NAD kinase
MKIGIIANLYNDRVEEVVRKLVDRLKKDSVTLFVEHKLRHILKDQCNFMPLPEMPPECDLVIVLGGMALF